MLIPCVVPCRGVEVGSSCVLPAKVAPQPLHFKHVGRERRTRMTRRRRRRRRRGGIKKGGLRVWRAGTDALR